MSHRPSGNAAFHTTHPSHTIPSRSVPPISIPGNSDDSNEKNHGRPQDGRTRTPPQLLYTPVSSGIQRSDPIPLVPNSRDARAFGVHAILNPSEPSRSTRQAAPERQDAQRSMMTLPSPAVTLPSSASGFISSLNIPSSPYGQQSYSPHPHSKGHPSAVLPPRALSRTSGDPRRASSYHGSPAPGRGVAPYTQDTQHVAYGTAGPRSMAPGHEEHARTIRLDQRGPTGSREPGTPATPGYGVAEPSQSAYAPPGSASAQTAMSAPASATGAATPGQYQLMTLQTDQGMVQFPVDVQAASRVADEKRRRNAGASARFRARRKEKEVQNSREIDDLKSHIAELQEDVEYYRRERDFFVGVVNSNVAERDRYFPRPPSPRHRRVSHGSGGPGPSYASTSPTASEVPSFSPYQEQGERGSEGRHTRRRVTGENYHTRSVTAGTPSPRDSSYGLPLYQPSSHPSQQQQHQLKHQQPMPPPRPQSAQPRSHGHSPAMSGPPPVTLPLPQPSAFTKSDPYDDWRRRSSGGLP